MTDGAAPSGTVTFVVYGPNDATCMTPVFTSAAQTVVASMASASYTPTQPGTYRWIATYGATPGLCDDPGEQSVVKAAPTLTTTASPTSALVGATIADSATLAGAFNPTGQITFKLYGPNDLTCKAAPVFTSAPQTVASSTASASYTPTQAGVYSWVATYAGDDNNMPASDACGVAAEGVAVDAVTPTMTTTASPSVPVGGNVTDRAVLAGGYQPGGSVTFNLYGPGDSTCGSPVFTSTVPVVVGTPTTSGAYVTTAAGTFRFIASYSGDAGNKPVVGACTDPAEAVVVTAAGTTPPPMTQTLPLPAPTPTPTSTKCVPQTMANNLVKSIVAALTGKPGSAFKATCGGSVRIVLRAKEIRPGLTGYPRHDGYTTIGDTLTHSSKTGQISFAINSQGTALRKYARSISTSLTVFAIVHIRPVTGDSSTESLRVFSLH